MQLMQKKPRAAATTTQPARTSDPASMFRATWTDIQNKRAGVPDAIPIPDETELERVRRKRAARRTGGRASTVLSDDNLLGG